MAWRCSSEVTGTADYEQLCFLSSLHSDTGVTQGLVANLQDLWIFAVETKVWQRLSNVGGGSGRGNTPAPRDKALLTDDGWMYGGEGWAECSGEGTSSNTVPKHALAGLWHWD